MTLVIPHRACPTGPVRKSWLNTTSGQRIYYDSWERTPASCGTPACAQAISFIDDVVLSDMKTGFTVRVSIYIPD